MHFYLKSHEECLDQVPDIPTITGSLLKCHNQALNHIFDVFSFLNIKSFIISQGDANNSYALSIFVGQPN